MGSRGFWHELKRRHVYRVAAAYAVIGWLLIQVVTQIFPVFHLPDWTEQTVVLVILIGFPIALVLAWAFDATPHAIAATEAVADGGVTRAPPRRRSRRAGVAVGAIGVMVALIAGGAYWHFGRAGLRAAPIRVAASEHPAGSPDGVKRKPGTVIPGSAAVAATSVPRTVTGSIAAQPIPAKSIAVLPFENLSDDRKNGYFVAGMQDLILTKLADIGDLKVVSRSSTEKYTSHPGDLDAIGRRLGVATLLEGRVQKDGKKVLINVQLIDAKTDSHIWAQSYARTLDNIFGVEGEVAQKVANALNARLTAAEGAAVARVPTTNPEAYDDYLRGLHFDNEAEKGDDATFKPQAIAAYEKAVREDPGFALAWASLSYARSSAFFGGTDRSKANLLAAGAAARRALQLDPGLPDAHEAMAAVERFLHHDLTAARDQNQQAVNLRPNDPRALDALAISSANLGDTHTAREAMRRAIALDPTDSHLQHQFGLWLASDGRYDEVRRAERRALAIDPQLAKAYMTLSEIDISQNLDVASATRALDQMAPGTPVSVGVVGWRIDLLLFGRHFDAARALAEKYSGQFNTGPAAVDMAFARARIEWLARKTNAARRLYRTAIDLATRSSAETEISAQGRARLGLAYARLGDADAARKESDQALAIAAKTHGPDLTKEVQYALAKTQLALGNKSAAIDMLTQVLAMRPDDIMAPRVSFLTRMQLDPTWDPVRKDPRFQALLKQYGHVLPAVVSRATHG
jgi:TolB-like protein/Tfp pilus assembly protein PilF